MSFSMGLFSSTFKILKGHVSSLGNTYSSLLGNFLELLIDTFLLFPSLLKLLLFGSWISWLHFLIPTLQCSMTFSLFHSIVWKFSLSAVSNSSLSFCFSYPTSISKSFRVFFVFLLTTFCYFMSSNSMFSLKMYASLYPVFISPHNLCFLYVDFCFVLLVLVSVSRVGSFMKLYENSGRLFIAGLVTTALK